MAKLKDHIREILKLSRKINYLGLERDMSSPVEEKRTMLVELLEVLIRQLNWGKEAKFKTTMFRKANRGVLV